MLFWIRRAGIAIGSLIAAGLSVWLIAAIAATLFGISIPDFGLGTGSLLVDVTIFLLGGAIYVDILRRGPTAH
jgi:hypothetical protein